MLDKLKKTEERFEALTLSLQQPEIYSDPAEYARLAREQKELAPIVEAYRRFARRRADAEEALSLLGDPEMREVAQEEYDAARLDCARMEQELKILLLPRDPNDDRGVVMEIRAGTGGEEAALFAGDLYRMYSMYADRKGWRLEIVNLNDTELGGVKEISIRSK